MQFPLSCSKRNSPTVMHSFSTQRCMLVMLQFALFIFRSVLSKQWPVLYPSISEKNLLVLNMTSRHLLDGHSAIKWFYCMDSTSDSIHSVMDRECDPSLLIMTSKSKIKLALSAVDENGRFTTLKEHSIPVILVNKTTAIVRESLQSNDFSERNFLSPATVEYEIEILLEEHPVNITVTVGNSTRSVKLYYDKRQPTWVWKLRRVKSKNFKCVVYFSEATFSSIGTYCDKRLDQIIPKFIDKNGVGYYTRDNIPGIVHSISTLQLDSTPCVEDLGEEKNLVIDYLFSNYSNIEPESLKAVLDASRKALTLTGKFKAQININNTKTKPQELTSREISLIIREFSLMDFSGNQLTESIAVEANATHSWYWSHQTGKEVGFVTSRTALATSAVAALAYLSPSSGSNVGIGGGSTGRITGLLTMGQKLYFIGLIGNGSMPINYQLVSSNYGAYALNIRFPWDRGQKNNQLETKQTSHEENEEKTKDDTVDSYEAIKKSLAILDVVESFELQSESDPFKALLQVLFYVAIVYTTLCLARWSLIGVVFILKKETPSLLIFPRLEILATFWVAPAIAAKCPGLLSKGAGGYILAIVVFGLFPGLFLCLQLALLHMNFFTQEPGKWRVRLVSIKDSDSPTEDAPDSIETNSESSEDANNHTEITISTNQALSTVQSDRREEIVSSTHPMTRSSPIEEQVSQSGHKLETHGVTIEPPSALPSNTRSPELYLTALDRLVKPFVGPPIDKTKWETVNHNDRFLERFGALFEDFRGPDHQTNSPSLPVSGSKWSFYRRAYNGRLIPLATALTDSFKLILLALVCTAELHEMEIGQLVFALCLCFGFFVFLRLLRPFRSRARLAVALLIEFVDCVTFILAIVAVSADENDQKLKEKCGFFMLCSQGVVYLLMMMEKISVACLHGILFCCSSFKKHLYCLPENNSIKKNASFKEEEGYFQNRIRNSLFSHLIMTNTVALTVSKPLRHRNEQ